MMPSTEKLQFSSKFSTLVFNPFREEYLQIHQISNEFRAALSLVARNVVKFSHFCSLDNVTGK